MSTAPGEPAARVGMGVRVDVVIPALDEGPSIGGVVRAALRTGVRRVVVVDNGSRDETAAAARAAGATVVSEPRRGYGSACQRGVRALPSDGDVVVFLDGDGSDEVAALPRLVEPIAGDQADLVVGTRVPEPGAFTAVQRMGNALAAGWLRRRFGLPASDLGPFRAVRRLVLDRFAMRDRGFGWTVEMQLKAARLGIRYAEIALPYRPRRTGASKISGRVTGSLGASCKILSLLAYHDLIQRRRSLPLVALIVLLVTGVSVPAAASGTYVGRAPLPPTRPDPVKYNRGKQLFNGEVAPAGPPHAAEAQARVLAALQARLPPGGAAADLAGIAGRLNATEFEAVRYFLRVRFGLE